MHPLRLIVLGTVPLFFAGHLFACLGEDPDFDKADSTGDAAPADALSAHVDAGAEASASTNTDDATDAAPDASGDACGATKDPSPCGCGAAKDCCLWEDGGTECFPAGNSPAECISGPHFLIACVGRGSCSPGQACCVVGGVLGGTCPTRLERWDTTCVPDGPNPCDGKRVLCASDSDCTLSDAGTCVAAVMNGLERPMGICVK